MKERKIYFGVEEWKEFQQMSPEEKEERYDFAFMNKVVFDKSEWEVFQSLKKEQFEKIEHIVGTYWPPDEYIEEAAQADWPNKAFCWWLIPPEIEEVQLFCDRYIGASILKMRGYPAIRDVTRYLFREVDYSNGHIIPELCDEMAAMPKDVKIEGINFLYDHPFSAISWKEVLYFMEDAGLKPEDFRIEIQNEIQQFLDAFPNF